MAEQGDKVLTFSAARVERLLDQLIEMAAQSEAAAPLPISDANDELDAISYAVNVLLGELRFSNATKAKLEDMRVAQAAALADMAEKRAEELHVAKEAADAANLAKSTFLSNISHELRTPVAVLVASAELLSKKKLGERETAELAERFLRSAHVLLGLLDTVLDLAKIESGRIDVRADRFLAASILNDARVSFAPQARDKGLTLRLGDAGAIPPLIGDAQRIRQILFNLLSNAIKYTDAGEIAVSVDFETGTAPMLSIAVADTGLGIRDEERGLLFQPFGRLTGSSSVAGTGLGLHLSSRLASALGGSLTLAYSAPGKGSRFELRIPVTAAEGLDAQANRPAEPDPLRGVRVLLADDHEDIRRLFGDLLSVEGATVVTANDGDAAVTRALSEPFDIVLLDVQMPGLNGLEAIAALRASGYTKPVLALTANATRAHRDRCLAGGFSGFVAKPVDLDAFVDTILRHVRP